MSNIDFIWDPKKDQANQKKHGISFSEAVAVFLDDNAKLIHDPDHSEQEDRFILLGLSNRLRILVVCHCYQDIENLIRIISARKANSREAEQYWQGIS
jgi:uncharacterized protein